MRTPPVLTASEAAALLPDGATVAISSSSAVGCPDAVLRAVGERFEVESSPRDITALLPINSGDLFGIKGVDHLAKKGLLRRILAGSLPSGPSKVDPPAIRRMVEADEVGPGTSPRARSTRCSARPRPANPGCSRTSGSARMSTRGSRVPA